MFFRYIALVAKYGNFKFLVVSKHVTSNSRTYGKRSFSILIVSTEICSSIKQYTEIDGTRSRVGEFER